MVSISAERINKTSPYKVEDGSRESFVDFTTDSGVEYSVGFEQLDLIESAPTFEFVIVNVNQRPSPRDKKLRDTIMAVVYDFFLSSNYAMLYICETGDGKQAMRRRLFHFWVNSKPQYGHFITWDYSITDEEGVENFVTLIIRDDNPKLREIHDEFIETIQLLKEKPQ